MSPTERDKTPMEITPEAQEINEQAMWDEVTADTEPADDFEPPAEAPAPAAEAAAPEPAPTEPAVDPLAGLPEPVRLALAAIPRLEHELRSAQGRIGALQRDQAQRVTAPAPEPAAPRTNPKLDALREELPEVAEALDELRSQSAPPVDAKAMRQQAMADVSEELLDTLRPNWGTELTSAPFQTWLATQPTEYRDQIAGTARAADITGALSKFDKHLASVAAGLEQQEQQRQQELQRQQQQQQRTRRAASAVTPNGVRKSPAKSEDDMSEDEYWNHITK